MRLGDRALELLKGVKVEGNLAKMQQLSRDDYLTVNKALEALGGKWNRKAKGHVFDCEDAGDRITEAITTGEVIDPNKELQFFETPFDLADRMVQLANIHSGLTVLEPSAGKGAIMHAVDKIGNIGLRKRAIEKHPPFAEHLEKHFQSSGWIISQDDFLWFNQPGQVDRVIMNPPFRNGQDIAHVQHAFEQLKPGGRLVAITSPGWTFREDKKHKAFRDWVLAINCDYEHLPTGTFKESGTMVNTVLLIINKPS